ncbi:MAG: response regulator transcription factor [bacterium]
MNLCLVEDNASFLKSLSKWLGREPDIRVLGAHASAEEALDLCPWGEVDILLADIDLPGISGVELIRQVRERYPAVFSMAFTISEDRATVFAALKAGAYGYVLKGDAPQLLVASLRELAQGGSPMSPSIARQVIREFHPAGVDEKTLTPREQAVLNLVAAGKLYKEIAEDLGLSGHTVHTHIKRIYGKLHAHGRADAVQKAGEAGLLRADTTRALPGRSSKGSLGP